MWSTRPTKLETIYNRIHEIRTRFEVAKRDIEIDYLKAVIAGGDKEALAVERDARLAQMDADYAFVADCNVGGEFMAPRKVERLKTIATRTWQRTLDDRIGLSWEEAQRKPKDKPTLPVTESCWPTSPNISCRMTSRRWPPTIPGASSSSRRRTNSIWARSIICRSDGAR